MDELARPGRSVGATANASAFADAVRPHMAALVRLAARIAPGNSPDDVVQDALIRAWRHRSQYDPKRGAFSSWIMAIVANKARRAAKRAWHMPRMPAPPAAVSSEERLDVEAAVRRLPPRQRLAVQWYYFAGLSIGDTAAVLEDGVGT